MVFVPCRMLFAPFFCGFLAFVVEDSDEISRTPFGNHIHAKDNTSVVFVWAESVRLSHSYIHNPVFPVFQQKCEQEVRDNADDAQGECGAEGRRVSPLPFSVEGGKRRYQPSGCSQ